VFVAFENAVKHNEISERTPMMIDVDLKDGMLYVINSVRERKNAAHSSKIGLKNLDERFRLVTGKGIAAGKENNEFVVRLPLIKI
jgi:sensor histidine kinase YesM